MKPRHRSFVRRPWQNHLAVGMWNGSLKFSGYSLATSHWNWGKQNVKKLFSAPETKGVWVFRGFCTWWSCEELATHPRAAKKISSQKNHGRPTWLPNFWSIQNLGKSWTKVAAVYTDLKQPFSHCLQHHQELDPPSCLATFCDIGGRRFVLRWGSPERLEPQKAGKKRPQIRIDPLENWNWTF